MRDKAISGCPDPDGTTGYGGALYASLHYDPLGRLLEVIDGDTSAATQFLYDGDALALEYDGSTILRRYLHGNNATADDPLLWYEGSNTADSNVRNLYADPPRNGSIETQ